MRKTLRTQHPWLYRVLATTYHLFRRGLGINTNEHIYVHYQALNVLFIALPKNANSTVNAMFFERLNIPYDKNNYQTLHAKKGDLSITKTKASHLAKQSDTYVFSLVRNPFERLVACWRNKIIEEDHDMQYTYFSWLRKDMSFEKFAERVCMIPDRFSDIHFRSQYAFLHPYGTPLYHYLANVDQFDKTMQPIMEKYDLTPLPAKNMSPTSDWRDLYTPDLARQVYERYKKDFETFGYEEELEKLSMYLREEKNT